MKGKMSKRKIVFCAQNPGGFNAIFSVIKKIIKRANLLVFLADEARDIAKRQKISYVDAGQMSDEQIKNSLSEFKPQIIVAGTSQGLSLDKKIIAWAKETKVPTVSIIDFWSNYKMRFSNPGTEDLAYLPDFICVVDDYMKKQMIKGGFKASQLFITGNPFFDTFKNYANIKGKYIVFAEQPFSELFTKSEKFDKTSNFNEVKILYDFVKMLERQKIKYSIFIALHPRCKNIKKFNKIIADSNLKIRIFRGNPNNLWKKAELILGINSMVLFQSALEGKKVLSYQPGLTKKEDPLMSNHLGLSEAVYSCPQLEKKIKEILKRKKVPKKNKAIIKKYVNNSTQKVINLVIKNI